MSALTDLFTAFANKIRSKTGGSDTYTPPEMVDAIDDVYDAGEAAGVAATKVGNAAAGDVLSGKTFTNSTTVGESGSMTNNGAVSATLNTSTTSYTVPAGYHNGSGTVSITTQTKSATPSTSAQTISPDAGKVLSSVSVGAIPGEYIIPSGTKSITANGTGIDVSSYASADVNVPNPTLSGDAATGNVLSGKTFYNTTYTKQTGSMTNRGAWTSTGNNCNASTTKDVTIPAGYHNGSGYVRFNSLSSQTGVDSGKTAIDASHVFDGYQGWVNGSKVSGTYTEPTMTDLTPDNVSPPSVSNGGIYKAKAGGYAISNYSSSGLTPSTSGQYFSSGWNRMTSSGYAYSSKPTLSWTTAWTNSSPSSAFASQTVSTSYTFSSYDFMRITYRFSTSNSTTASIIIPKGSYTTFTKLVIGANSGSGNTRVRPFQISGSSIIFDTSYQTTSSSQSVQNGYIIPTKIEVSN